MEKLAILYADLDNYDIELATNLAEQITKVLPPHIGFVMLPNTYQLKFENIKKEENNGLRSLYYESF